MPPSASASGRTGPPGPRPLLPLLLLLLQQATAGPECKMGEACIFMGKADGWERFQDSGPRPPPVASDSWMRDDTTIFYSISSFRDELCPRTLFNAFSKAAHPLRIRVGVVQQNTAGDVDCLERYCEMMAAARNTTRAQCPHESQVTMNRQRAEDAKGPTWARAIGSAMVGEEEFCMQTDSHMDFVRNWDRNLLSAWALTGNEYAVLSTYVTAIEELAKVEDGGKGINGQHEVPHLCMISKGYAASHDAMHHYCIRTLHHFILLYYIILYIQFVNEYILISFNSLMQRTERIHWSATGAPSACATCPSPS
jgi:hypothetical protein